MSKSNNKGFSLIDVIIAVAVMSILISPIIAQVITTVDTSSRAKERQYVIDNADMVMDYFRTKTVKELSETGYKGDPVSIKKVEEFDYDVTLYDFEATGSEDYDSYSYFPVKYHAINYTLGSYDKASDSLSDYEILGRENNRYSRVVTLDDLSAVCMENGLVINYKAGKGKTDADKERMQKLEDIGFEFTSEGSAVMYDPVDGHITAVACLNSVNSNYKNPNSATPVITDIDSQKMAIIEGDASTIDNQFENDIIKEMVSYVASHKTELSKYDSNGALIAEPDKFEGETLYDFLRDNNNLNDELNDIRVKNVFRRAIRLYVTGEDVVSNEPSYYRVRCVVTYYAKFTSKKLGSMDKTFTYTVFDQKFNTVEPPDVFFVYEPLVLKTNAKTAEAGYSPYEFFYVQSDEYTSGVNKHPEDNGKSNAGKYFEASKIYLIKAETNWAQAVVNKKSSEQILHDKETDEYYYYFLSRSGGSVKPVKIFVNQIKQVSSKAQPLQIITNISWRPNDAEGDVGHDNPIINQLYKLPSSATYVPGGWQFFPNKPSADPEDQKYIGTPDVGLEAGEQIYKYPLDLYTTSTIGKIEIKDETTDEVVSSCYAIDAPTEDTVDYGRLYTITIKYNNIDRPTENSTSGNRAFMYFTGAKGAD